MSSKSKNAHKRRMSQKNNFTTAPVVDKDREFKEGRAYIEQLQAEMADEVYDDYVEEELDYRFGKGEITVIKAEVAEVVDEVQREEELQLIYARGEMAEVKEEVKQQEQVDYVFSKEYIRHLAAQADRQRDGQDSTDITDESRRSSWMESPNPLQGSSRPSQSTNNENRRSLLADQLLAPGISLSGGRSALINLDDVEPFSPEKDGRGLSFSQLTVNLAASNRNSIAIRGKSGGLLSGLVEDGEEDRNEESPTSLHFGGFKCESLPGSMPNSYADESFLPLPSPLNTNSGMFFSSSSAQVSPTANY